jgi:lipoprotein-releasing system ATP-binding protein
MTEPVPILECRGVEKAYHDGTRELRILRGVNLAVHTGEVLLVTGPSGVGKSTLLHIMGTLDRPTAGDVLYRGDALGRMPRAAVNRFRNQSLGFVFQFYHLLPEFTALENVMMPALCRGRSRADCRERAESLLETVGLSDRMTHRPGMLSGGEQQRAAIARALFNEPDVVLADEPTGNLDEATGAGVMELLMNLNATNSLTLVLVSHDERIGERVRRWVHLHEGVAETRK